MSRLRSSKRELLFLAFFALIKIPRFLLAQSHARQAVVGVRPSLFDVRFLFEISESSVAAVWDLLSGSHFWSTRAFQSSGASPPWVSFASFSGSIGSPTPGNSKILVYRHSNSIIFRFPLHSSASGGKIH